MKTELDEQQRDYLTKLDQSAGDLQDIIDSILDFTKLQEGELECVERSFSLASVVEGLDRTWRGSIEDAGLEFALDIDPDLPAALVGDDKRIKQVLGNFLSNAVKFTEQGRVTLSLKLKERGDETVRLRFGVSDTGIGIAPDTHQQLFEAFAQADSSLTREYGGTGLGLPIARHLVELMGGSVEVESEPGRGSCFAFELELPLAEEGGGAGEAEAYIDLAPIMGGRVLLVDDSDLNLQVAGELLKQANLYVDVAHDGAQAVEMVLSHDYDCVLMDVQMPVMDGYAATREIRSRKKFASLPILAMTANALPQDRARGAEAGMNAYIPKPIDPDELYRSLLAWIEPGPRPFDVSDFASPPTNFDSPGGLPDQVAGINIADGLARVGGNSTLYLTLLADLCKDYDDAAQRIEVMLAGGDTDGSSQLAHKLRGIANNLGASALGDSAAKIEARLKSAEPLASDDLTRLAEAMELTRESQRQLAPPDQEQGAHSELDAVGRSDLFQELVQAVASNDPAAGDLAARLLAATTADDEIHDALSAAHDALDIYDFTTAAAQLESVAASMDG